MSISRTHRRKALWIGALLVALLVTGCAGIVAGADAHTGFSDNEEFNYTGVHGVNDDTPKRRLSGAGQTAGEAAIVFGTPGATGVWADPDFDPKLNAVYYVRVLEIPRRAGQPMMRSVLEFLFLKMYQPPSRNAPGLHPSGIQQQLRNAFFVKMKIFHRLSRPSESIPLKKDQG